MTKPLSAKALAIWNAFNDVSERVGVFEDYGDALAAALRAAAEHLDATHTSRWDSYIGFVSEGVNWSQSISNARSELLAIAYELEGK